MSRSSRNARLCAGALGWLAWTVPMLQAPALAGNSGILDVVQPRLDDGRHIYEHLCRGCHMADAGGAIGAGYYPALAMDLRLASRQYMALTILTGRRNMPAFGVNHAAPPAVLSDAQIAEVVNYVRSHFGNAYKDRISAAEVSALDSASR